MSSDSLATASSLPRLKKYYNGPNNSSQTSSSGNEPKHKLEKLENDENFECKIGTLSTLPLQVFMVEIILFLTHHFFFFLVNFARQELPTSVTRSFDRLFFEVNELQVFAAHIADVVAKKSNLSEMQAELMIKADKTLLFEQVAQVEKRIISAMNQLEKVRR